MIQHSLLSEGVFHVTGADGAVACLSLPQVLARLSEGEDLGFDALRPHQGPAWHAFLVQLAFLALEAQEEAIVPTTAPAWAQALRSLTPDHADDAPWCLVNTDWQRPAFLQAPCSAAHEADFKLSSDSAQDIDVLVTARHHDEKTGKLPLHEGVLDSLVFALVTLQGWSSFMGKGNYNTMRMNGGFSSRPQFRLVFGPRNAGAEFLRDLAALQAAQGWLVEQAQALGMGTGNDAPHSLLWLLPWDTGSLSLDQVHPLCLEVCRRVRLVQAQGRLLLRRASSDAMRVAAKDRQGHVLDPWVPLIADGADGVPKALTAQAHTLGYRTLQGLLFDRSKARLPLLAAPSEAERLTNRPGTLLAQVLVSGDGRTDGLLVREVPMPAPVLARLVTEQAALAQRSQAFVALAGQAAGKAYRSALLQFVDGRDAVDWKNRDFTRAVEPWADRFEQAVDEVFFSTLFHTFETALDDAAAQRLWVLALRQIAQRLLQEAIESLPTRDKSRWFARARAERFLRLAWHKQFASLLATPEQASSDLDQEPAHG